MQPLQNHSIKFFSKQETLLIFISIFCFTQDTHTQDRQILLNGNTGYAALGEMGPVPAQGTLSFFAKLNAKNYLMDALSTGLLGGCSTGNRGFRFEYSQWHPHDTGFIVVIGDDSADCNHLPNTYTLLNPSSVQLNTWYHFALVWNKTTNNAKGYVNGKEVFNHTTTRWPSYYFHVLIGSGFDTYRKWNGGVDEVTIWKKALMPAEIKKLAEGNIDLRDPALKGWWNSETYYRYGHLQAALNIFSTGICQDHKGYIWIATNTGLRRFDGVHYRIYYSSPGEPNALHTNYTTAVFEDSHQRMWIGTADQGVLLFARYSNNFYSFNYHLKNNEEKLTGIWKIMEDKEGNICVQAKEGFYRLNAKSNRFEKYKPVEEINEKIYCIVYDHNGNEWLVTETGLKFYDTRSKKVLDKNNTVEHIPVQDISNPCSAAVDKQNNLWISSNSNHTIYKYNITTQKINDYYLSQRFDKKAAKSIHDKISLGKIFIDSHQNVWLSVLGAGLAKYNAPANNFSIVAADNNSAGSYDSSLIPRNENYSMMEDREGNLWVAGFSNFLWLHSGSLGSSSIPQNVTITKFISYDKNAKATRDYLEDSILDKNLPVHLNYPYDHFDIEYASLQFNAADTLKYYIRMDGIDMDWVDAENNNSEGYHDLLPGRHFFHVKCVNQFGVPCKKETILEIIIDPPYWQTWWFRALVILAGAAFIYWLVSLRIKYIRKKEAEKNALALQMAALETKALRSQMNPHFIFNALNAIKKFLLKKDVPNADKYLSSFAKLLRLILENTRENKVILENEISLLELYLQLEHLRFEDRLTYHIDVDEKIKVNETEIPSMLIQPFVENAIVHGLQHKEGKGFIKISFHQRDGWIEAVIEDDGIGRKAAALRKNESMPYKSLAIKISEERLLSIRKNKTIPAGITIIDLKNEQDKACGTKVIICIPVE